MLKVYYTELSSLPESTEGMNLSGYRINKLSKAKLPEKRRQNIGAELLLNFAVKQIYPDIPLPLSIYTNEHGKPFLKDLPLHFSLSHSGDYVVCAVSESEIGVDIEQNSGYNPTIVKRFFNETETGFIERAKDKNNEFRRIWTAKESALKYLGRGLTRSLNSVGMQGYKSLLLIPEGIELKLIHFALDESNISICTALEDEIYLEYVMLK